MKSQKMKKIEPFANESDSLQIDDLTIENRLDRVSIYGSIEITRDKKGLSAAHILSELLNSILNKLSQGELPETLPTPENIDEVKNPFD
jgi:hypothetical protein